MSIAIEGALSYKGYIDKLNISPRLPTFLRLWSTWLSAALTTMSPLDVSTSAASPLTTTSWSQDPSVCQSFMPWCSAPVTVRYDNSFLSFLMYFYQDNWSVSKVGIPLKIARSLVCFQFNATIIRKCRTGFYLQGVTTATAAPPPGCRARVWTGAGARPWGTR